MPAALLIIDLQRTLCEGRWAVDGVDALIARVNTLAARARAAGAPVVFVQHASGPAEPMAHGSEGWQLAPALDVQATDWRVDKRHGDAFLRTDLHARLQAAGVDHLVLAGAQSDFCVSATAQGGLSHGYAVTLAADAHSTLGNGVLTADQIIAHVNATVAHMDSYGPPVAARAAAEVRF